MDTWELLAAPESCLICPPISESLRLNSCVLFPEEGGLGLRQADLRGSLQRSSSNGNLCSSPLPERGQASSAEHPASRAQDLHPPPSRSLCPCAPRTASLGRRRSLWASIPAASSVSTAFRAPSSTKLQVGLAALHPCPTLPWGSQGPSAQRPGTLSDSTCIFLTDRVEKSLQCTLLGGGGKGQSQPGEAVTDPHCTRV